MQFEANCYYCQSYQDVISSYPSNVGEYDLNDNTPRCRLHWQYECNQCGDNIHFNGIAWCGDCKKFTCINCSQPRLREEKFLIYTYYYQLDCDCGNLLNTLDYAEYVLEHPYQIGDIHPRQNLRVWAPLGVGNEENSINHQKYSGRGRINKLCSPVRFKPVNPSEVDSGKIWDELSSFWLENWPEGGDFHHKQVIIPEVIRLLDPYEDDVILDVACGEGGLCRLLRKEYAVDITGIDISNMIDHAIQKEQDEQAGITFHRLSAHKLTDKFEPASFDKVVCNMALMDIADLPKTLDQISSILDDNGIFVFSITHPCFAWPTTKNLKLPADSQRNEDKSKVYQNYFNEGPVIVEYDNPDRPSMLYYKRTLSTYFSELKQAGFDIIEFCEPQVDEETARLYPRKAYQDLDEVPEFLIMKVKK